MDDTQAPKVDNYKEKVKTQAENLVLKDFPKKIIELEELLKLFNLQTDLFKQKDLSSLHCDLNIPLPEAKIQNDSEEPALKKRKINSQGDVNDVTGLKVMALPNGGRIPSNSKIVEIVDIVKPKIKQLVEDANLLKMWIQFLIPRIEDGNNFGVSIQEDTLGEIRTVESEAATFYDQISRYFLTRGKIVARVAKYPYIDDFRRTVNELDEKEYISMWLMLCELRNHYAGLHDLITKNMEKIKKPRSTNTDTMY